VEAFIPGWGWVAFDPTPAAPAEAAAGAFQQARLVLDALETWWNEWVVQYDLGRQIRLARNVQGQMWQASYQTTLRWERARARLEKLWLGWKQEPKQLWPVLALLAAAAAAWGVRRLRPLWQARAAARRAAEGRGTSNDCALLFDRAVRAMHRWGFSRQPWQTPAEFAASLAGGAPNPEAFREVTTAYNLARFAGDAEAARRLPALVRRLEART
jgi:hypothetical protein